MNNFLIGIAGGSGSGKSTLAQAIVRELPDVSVVSFDDYGVEQKAPRIDDVINWDSPRAFDFEKLAQDLQSLKRGEPITVLSRGDHHIDPTLHTITVEPSKVIILEGFLTLYDPQVRGLLDYSVYLDAPFETLLARRPEKTTPEYASQVLRPMYEEFVLPTKDYADEVYDAAQPGDAVTGRFLKSLQDRLPTE